MALLTIATEEFLALFCSLVVVPERIGELVCCGCGVGTSTATAGTGWCQVNSTAKH
jgi:hypothetical protein